MPLIKAGFVDWIVATGAILYHDLHFALNYPIRMGSFKMDDTDLRDNDIVRVYDVLMGYSDCLMATDETLRNILRPAASSRRRWARRNCTTCSASTRRSGSARPA